MARCITSAFRRSIWRAPAAFTQPAEFRSKEFSLDLARPIVLFCQHAIATEQRSKAVEHFPAISDPRTEGSGTHEGFQVVVILSQQRRRRAGDQWASWKSSPDIAAGAFTVVKKPARAAAIPRHAAHDAATAAKAAFWRAIRRPGSRRRAPAFGCHAGQHRDAAGLGRLRAANVIDTDLPMRPSDDPAVAIRKSA